MDFRHPTRRLRHTRQAAYDLRKLRAKALITKAGRSRRYGGARRGPNHLCLAHFARPGHRSSPCCCSQPPHGTLAFGLDSGGSPLREPPDRHGGPVQRLGDRRRRIDNPLPIGDRQAPSGKPCQYGRGDDSACGVRKRIRLWVAPWTAVTRRCEAWIGSAQRPTAAPGWTAR